RCSCRSSNSTKWFRRARVSFRRAKAKEKPRSCVGGVGSQGPTPFAFYRSRRFARAFYFRVHFAIDSLDRRSWIFEHHVFLDHARVDRERKWRYRRQLQQLPFVRVDIVQEFIRALGIEKCVRRLAIRFDEQRMVWLVPFEDTKQNLRAPVQLLQLPFSSR